ncbi:MAG: CinA family nicotinamide mononucleotide deamidase-related protein [Planctomycetaceae bacterium]|nr:CinA family nicotinamide mononucleotide deamidase-related protein [Planctomycetaceae bacterium]
MKAEVIAIGSELTDGAKLDTNTQWLSQQLTDLGVTVHFHTTVADDLQENVDVLRTAVDRADIILVTGGLGPTLDDLTRQAMAELMDVDLELHAPSLNTIRKMFESRNREMPQRNEVQAMFPHGSEPLTNPVGTAPGIWMEVPRVGARPPACIAAMPGVPSEMHRMFEKQVKPRLPVSAKVIRRARLNCFGLGESHTEQILGDLTARGNDPEVGITASEATITLRITARGDNEQQCEDKIRTASETARRLLGHYIFGTEDEDLQHVAINLLTASGQTLATVESGTGGLLSHRLTEVPDFEKCYTGGLILPTESSQQRELEISATLFQEHDSISEAIAAELARRCRERLSTSFAIAITSDRGRAALTDPSMPAAYVAVASADDVRTLPVHRIGNWTMHRSRTVKTALNLLRLELLGVSLDDVRKG